MSSIRAQIQGLYRDLDPDLKAVIREVLDLELDYIHMERPRVKDQIDKILDRVAKEALERENISDEA